MISSRRRRIEEVEERALDKARAGGFRQLDDPAGIGPPGDASAPRTGTPSS